MALLRILIFMLIHFICGLMVMVAHEYPKKVAAYFLVHPIYRTKKLFTIPLKKYIDPIGLLLFTLSFAGVGAGQMSFYSFYAIGWQKPYEFNPSRFRSKEKDLLYISLIGQLFSLLFMFTMIPIFNYFNSVTENLYILEFFWSLIVFNFTIFIVNLLPIPPFDMAKAIYSFSPTTYFKITQNQRIFHLVFVLLIAMGMIQMFVASTLIPVIQVFL